MRERLLVLLYVSETCAATAAAWYLLRALAGGHRGREIRVPLVATGVALGFIGVTLGIVSRLSGPIDLASTPALSRVIFAIAVSLIGWALSRLPGRGTVGRPVLWSAYIAMAVVFSLNEWFLML